MNDYTLIEDLFPLQHPLMKRIFSDEILKGLIFITYSYNPLPNQFYSFEPQNDFYNLSSSKSKAIYLIVCNALAYISTEDSRHLADLIELYLGSHMGI